MREAKTSLDKNLEARFNAFQTTFNTLQLEYNKLIENSAEAGNSKLYDMSVLDSIANKHEITLEKKPSINDKEEKEGTE